MPVVRKTVAVVMLAYDRFNLHDGWAIASHIALSALFSFFPFLILLTALASAFAYGTLADNAAEIILELFPGEIAVPLAREVHSVLTEWRGDLLTIGAALALYFSSNGIESLRVGLNRAYGVRETRPWWLTRLESIAFVIVVAIVMLFYSFAIVLGPLLWRAATGFFPAIAPFAQTVDVLRLGVTTVLVLIALLLTHKFLAAGRRTFGAVLPGVFTTFGLWLVGGFVFGTYLAQYPAAYASTYGGLATAMMALIFLYLIAVIFIFGGELNGAVIAARRSAKRMRGGG